MEPKSLPAGIAAVVAMAIAVGFTFNAFSPDGIPLIRVAPVKVAVPDSAIFGAAGGDTAGSGAPEAAGFRVITLAQMERALEERRGVVYDARTPEEYVEGHIPGAENLYAMAPETWIERIAEVPRDTLVLIYCSNPHCPYGRTLAEFLGSFGFTNLLLFDDGWDAWSEAGLPAATGEGGK